MSCKIFVGGLDFSLSDAELREAFAQFGDIVESKVIMDRETGRSRGFGFVTFKDAEAAKKAIAEMNGQELSGRTIRVDKAQERR